MKTITRVRYAAHLMAYIEELHELRKFNTQELHVIQDALLLLIIQIQQDSAKNQLDRPLDMLLPISTKTYEFQQGNYAPNRILVYEDGLPERRLRHIPIFAYGFGLAGLPALDSALAILADYFGETLSMRAFAAGESHYCHLYQPFAREVLNHHRSSCRFEAKRIETFLRRAEGQKIISRKSDSIEKENHDANKQATQRII